MATNSLDMNNHPSKLKKDKKKFVNMFKRHKKNKDKHHDVEALDQDSLGASIGTVENQHSFSSLKKKRKVPDKQSSYLTPPTYARRRSKSNPALTGSNDEYTDIGIDKDFIATLLNPSLAVADQTRVTTLSPLRQDTLHAPAIRVSIVCGVWRECGVTTVRSVFYLKNDNSLTMLWSDQ